MRMTSDLEIKTILKGAPYEFSGPRYLDVAPDGTLVVADEYTHSVKIIAENGKVLGGPGPAEARCLGRTNRARSNIPRPSSR